MNQDQAQIAKTAKYQRNGLKAGNGRIRMSAFAI